MLFYVMGIGLRMFRGRGYFFWFFSVFRRKGFSFRLSIFRIEDDFLFSMIFCRRYFIFFNVDIDKRFVEKCGLV